MNLFDDERIGLAVALALIVCAAGMLLILALNSCTYVRTPGWTFADLHPFRDMSAIEYESRAADGSWVSARLGHQVRPEGESATQGTVRRVVRYGFLGLLALGGISGNLPVAATGAVGAAATQ